MKFDRCDQSVFSTSRFTSGLPHSKLAVASATELIGTNAIDRSVASPSMVTAA